MRGVEVPTPLRPRGPCIAFALAAVGPLATLALASVCDGCAGYGEAVSLGDAELRPRPHVDFFSHAQGLLVLDCRLCAPGNGSWRDVDLLFEFFAGEGGSPLVLHHLRPFAEPGITGYSLVGKAEVSLPDGGGPVASQLHWPWWPGDCLGWRSTGHGVVTFEEAGDGPGVLLLLPGAELLPGERIERQHMAGPIARSYSARLSWGLEPGGLRGPSLEPSAGCVVEERHWALSSSSGTAALPSADGEWSAGNANLCEAGGSAFFTGRLSFLGLQSPLLFGLCAPASCSQEEVRSLARALLERLAPRGAEQLRRVDARKWRPDAVHLDGVTLVLSAVVLLPGATALLCRFAGSEGGQRSRPGLFERLCRCQQGHTVEAQWLRACCATMLVAHLLLGLDVFCSPGPPRWVWSDADTLLGYLSTHALFLLSATMFLSPVPGPGGALRRLLRKWLRVAPVGLALRVLACGPGAQPSRPWRSSVGQRCSPQPTLDVLCQAPRCTTAHVCAEPIPGLPFGVADVILGFPEVSDVGWFLEADLVHSAILAGLCTLRGLGLPSVAALLTVAWVGCSAWQLLPLQPTPRQFFDCTRPLLAPGLPYVCLNFALGPLLAWLACLGVAPALSFRATLLAIAAALAPWVADCAVLRRLGLPQGCYTGACEGPEGSLLGWNWVRGASLVGLHVALSALLRRRTPARPGLLSAADRLAFCATVATPLLLRRALLTAHSACLEFNAFALAANWLGILALAACCSVPLRLCVQEPWERLPGLAALAVPRLVPGAMRAASRSSRIPWHSAEAAEGGERAGEVTGEALPMNIRLAASHTHTQSPPHGGACLGAA